MFIKVLTGIFLVLHRANQAFKLCLSSHGCGTHGTKPSAVLEDERERTIPSTPSPPGFNGHQQHSRLQSGTKLMCACPAHIHLLFRKNLGSLQGNTNLDTQGHTHVHIHAYIYTKEVGDDLQES